MVEKKSPFFNYFLSLLLTLIPIAVQTADFPACGDGTELWTTYKDEKCFKIIDTLVTHVEAVEICKIEIGEFTRDPLMTIKSAEEQEFLNQLIFQEFQIVDNIWLGATRRVEEPTEFEWGDGIKVNYTNWAEGSPSEELSKSCTQITSKLSKNRNDVDGLWSDASCLRRNLVVCEKTQMWSLAQIKSGVLNLAEDLNNKTEQLNQLRTSQDILQSEYNELLTNFQNLQATHNEIVEDYEHFVDNPVPLNFVYVQLPNQPSPNETWPNVEWTEITDEYAGLFFRAEGGNSEVFGVTQLANTTRISNVRSSYGTTDESIAIPTSGWSPYIRTGTEGTSTFEGLRFYSSVDEIRPKNTAIRIWKRTA